MLGHTHHVGRHEQKTKGVSAEEAENAEHKGMRERLKTKIKDSPLYDLKIKGTHTKNKIGKYQNLFNQDHRHDEPHEQLADKKRTLIAESHRFQSFAPEREGNNVKWYVDGRDYFYAVSVALERATETIYIADWWLSPELFLRRPPHFNQEWRLDQTLKRAAERGVKIYVVVYKEMKQALTCNSAHTKAALTALCPEGTPGHGNIAVMRHPDHNVFENAGDMTFYWAHHEKFIVIDFDLAFIGGLDMCFGRWDARHHPLADAHPSGVQNEIWPGQDFNNNRIMDFHSVDEWNQNEVSKTDYARMPWHDVSMGVIGPCVYDIAEHFVLRWNFCKRDKYKRDERYDWLTLEGREGDMEDLVGVQRPKHPIGDYIHHPLSDMANKTGRPGESARLLDDGSESSDDQADEFHDAEEQIDEHGYRPDQHRTPSLWMHDHVPHRPKHHDQTDGEAEGLALPPGVKDGEPRKQENYKVTGNDPGEEGTVAASGGVAEKSKEYRSEVAGANDRVGQGPVRAQVVRSSADWSSGILTESSIQNAYCQIIRDAQHFVYIENQFFITATGDQQAPVHNLIGKAIVDAVVRAAREERKFRVIIVMPAVPGFAGDLRTDAAAGTRAIMGYQYKSILRGEHSIFGRIEAEGVNPRDYVFIFNLRSYDRINYTPELKQELEASGMSYQELQRAQAEEIVGQAIEGAPGESAPAKDRETTGDAVRDRFKHHEAQPTGAKGVIKRAVRHEMHDESSESDSDREERMKERYQRGPTGAEKREKFDERRQQWQDERREQTGEGDKAVSEATKSIDSIAADAMLGESKPSEENWAGREPGEGPGDPEDMRESEKENFVQEELYIHSKVGPQPTPSIGPLTDAPAASCSS